MSLCVLCQFLPGNVTQHPAIHRIVQKLRMGLQMRLVVLIRERYRHHRNRAQGAPVFHHRIVHPGQLLLGDIRQDFVYVVRANRHEIPLVGVVKMLRALHCKRVLQRGLQFRLRPRHLLAIR